MKISQNHQTVLDIGPLNSARQLNSVEVSNNVGQLSCDGQLDHIEQSNYCCEKGSQYIDEVNNSNNGCIEEELFKMNIYSPDFSSSINIYNLQQLMPHDISFKNELLSWVLQQQIAHRGVNDLLKICRRHDFNELPQDVRTLMKTPRNAIKKIEYGNGGAYMHFEIANIL